MNASFTFLAGFGILYRNLNERQSLANGSSPKFGRVGFGLGVHRHRAGLPGVIHALSDGIPVVDNIMVRA